MCRTRFFLYVSFFIFNHVARLTRTHSPCLLQRQIWNPCFHVHGLGVLPEFLNKSVIGRGRKQF